MEFLVGLFQSRNGLLCFFPSLIQAFEYGPVGSAAPGRQEAVEQQDGE
jgi:hypothetical protein